MQKVMFTKAKNSKAPQNDYNQVIISDKDIAAVDKSSLFLVSKTVFKEGVLGNFEIDSSERGQAVNTDNQDASRRANHEFGFDTYVSDKISLHRSIPDTRPDECKYWHYPYVLPKTTVVVVFHNEGWSPLLRTVHSIIDHTPVNLLREVLLVDDFSDKHHLKRKLDTYIKTLGKKVRLVRNKQREGLIRSRSIGAENALGEVVVFLDAHCECNTNWLPPLLAPIAEDSRTVTVPVIDSIDMNTWAYHPQYGGRTDILYRGIFEWGLLYKETELPEEEMKDRKYNSAPFRSPTHAGGLFAINRKWFERLGYYDPGLQIWGGENFELSFKVWQCGGRVLNVPCSRVGHVYRSHMPYKFGNLSGPIISTRQPFTKLKKLKLSSLQGNGYCEDRNDGFRNYKRVAEVWMDEYKEYYYAREPFMRYRNAGDLSKQKLIRQKNNCKNFSWYMNNIAYDMPRLYPAQPPNVAWGELINVPTKLCVDTMGQPIPGTLGVSGCHGYGGNQACNKIKLENRNRNHGLENLKTETLYRVNTEGQMSTGEWCITAVGSRLQTGRCRMGSINGYWEYRKETQQLYHKKKDKCLNVDSSNEILNLANCDTNNEYQKFRWKQLRI
uniref:Polypeptide N-acetylgalactosaminyltransferase n=1 Tax=Romanomermis culicivorax TaxID=13658 RepID=A0A915K183_ROMCU